MSTEFNKLQDRQSNKRAQLSRQSWEKVFRIIGRKHKQPRHVIEWFGGTGKCSEIIQEILKPEVWEIFEIDAECARLLREKFPQAHVTQADSYQFGNVNGTVVVLDFDKWSVLQFNKLIPVLEGGAKWIVVTDHAIQRIAINGPKSYTKVVGYPVRNMEEYLQGLNYLVREYGYCVSHCISHYAVSKIILRKGVYHFDHEVLK